MERIDLPDGSWIEVRDAAEVTERLRRPHLAAWTAYANTEPSTKERAVSYRNMVDMAVVAYVADWSFGGSVTLDALLDLPSLAYDQIVSVIEPKVDGLKWTLVPTPEARADPKATTDVPPSSEPGSTILMPPPAAVSSESNPNT